MPMLLNEFLPEDQEWKARGNCVVYPRDMFFPGQGGLTAPAKAVCEGCPVAEECLAYGLDEKFGIWGGTSERGRRELRRQRDRARLQGISA